MAKKNIKQYAAKYKIDAGGLVKTYRKYDNRCAGPDFYPDERKMNEILEESGIKSKAAKFEYQIKNNDNKTVEQSII
ncbi:MAG: hypothetical protein COS99_00195 [Candidatus Omnitrophica bacterium CG07_land_8_20_14_0_80_42_15]|uniref:Uncharacterized protein n=1 Tax=Candidatus Aquitaenariimonas noxiae TaxID=1974741 RepID=A0A2J0KVN2_9BACT|nr:MAG: hypothetical protein COS99_00195 [Candidatus Omnitrophica bacterium CG07_land_8_20_14_0_80_42_15]